MTDAGRLILAINPGGTSTKTGIFREADEILTRNIRHAPDELSQYGSIIDQHEFRRAVILRTLEEAGFKVRDLTAVVGRGGAFRPLESGTYGVNRKMIDDIHEGATLQADHPSNLGALLAFEVAAAAGLPSFIVDPVCVDEMIDEARLSGLPVLPRVSLSHALNIRMVAYKAAAILGRKLSELDMVVLHLGSGISVNALRQGRMIDTSNANDGGPFSPRRVGALPTTGLLELCFSGNHTLADIKRMLLREGGLYAYTGTDHVGEALERAEKGDAVSSLALRAMTYQIIKEGGAMAAALRGSVDAVVVTGGIARNRWVVDRIREGLGFLGRIIVFAGEKELEALVRGVLRVLDSVEEVKVYR